MKTLTKEQIQLINAALIHYAAEQENVISKHYLDLDQEEIVAESEKILVQLDSLMSVFRNNEALLILNKRDTETLDIAFNRSDDIFASNDNYVLKSGMFVGLIDGIKAVIKGKY
jgi:hypothetical protein